MILHTTGDLRARGTQPSRGLFHHVRPGVWMAESAQRELEPVDRHAALVHATAKAHRHGDCLIFVAASAAAVHGFPRITS
ncbi:hypothetical protein N803_04560 [Knoellia subterranea KCTC 19937]|uniref:Uncharacterized protein n=1 Tax=Knoellia subterranea KCTC 19937 TaxID=1385521 RepID=A0A0A0JIJ5_9MICO|nr:hypothetical protein N803_04560 [Knoellia subterranea KCTC 19937]